MVQSTATTVAEYLAALDDEPRTIIKRLRALVRKRLPKGYAEVMRWGMITYEVPLRRYPTTYNGQPLQYVGLAAQKRHYGVYLMTLYPDTPVEQALKAAFADAGVRFDKGVCCLRLKSLDGVPLDAIGDAIAGTNVDDFIAMHERAHAKKRRTTSQRGTT